ncbi:hypothetical protein KKE06_04330 [Candidatus Micrarchaeota archaeon]|nr:hypothetical protein [Candidatus Micrarchaeota archaeon]MBU1930328.1 hypothetical protein [Candidatus Micrarchaeota archaeon]
MENSKTQRKRPIKRKTTKKAQKASKRTFKHAKKRVSPKKTKKKRPIHLSKPQPRKKPLEERLLEWNEDDEAILSPHVNEKMREQLLKEEFKLRKKQPTAWTKTKYRKFAMFAFNRKKKEGDEETKEEKTTLEAKK